VPDPRRAARAVVERVRATLDAARQAVPALDLVWELALRFRRRNGAVLAGYITYRLFIWLVPMLLVLVAGVGFSNATNLDLVRYATEYEVSSETARDAVEQAARGRVAALAIGLGALAWATLGLVRGVHYAFAQAWGMTITPRKHLIRDGGYFLVAAIVVLLLLLAVGALQRQGPLFALLGSTGSIALVGISLFWVCLTMPRRTTRWLDLVPGVVVGTVGLAILQVFAAVYIPDRIARASVLYGGIGVALGLLFYLFLMAYLLVGAAFVNSVWTDRAKIIAGRPWVLDPDGLPRWLRRPARWALDRHRERP
jgi:uncharacterized BrkB/YihY/UPF0761 family membrane protein